MGRWLKTRLSSLFLRSRMEGELDRELAFHIDMLTEQNLRAGMSPVEARTMALRQFGRLDGVKEAVREAWLARAAETLTQDIRYGLRNIRRNRGFAFVIVLTVVLMAGARAAWIGLGVGVALVAWRQLGRRRGALALGLALLVTLLAGVVAHTLSPRFAERIAKPVSLIATILLAVACLPVLFSTWPIFWQLVGDGVLVSLLLFSLIGLAVGHFLGGPDPNDRTVLALATSTRHPGVAMAIANLTFPDEKTVFAVVLFHLILGAIATIPYVKWRTRALKEVRAP